MDTRDLKAFVAVYKMKSINAAARELFITPQGLSQIIKRLEQELEVELFIRDNVGVHPTTYGNALYESAQSIISEMDAIKKGILLKGKGQKYTLNVASTLGVIDYLTVRFIKSFRESYPDINLCVVENPDRSVQERLMNDEAEIGFLAGPVNTAIFNAIPFTKHRHCLVINKDHPLAQKACISYIDLDKQPIALEGRDFMPYHNNRNRFLNAHSQPIIVMETTEIVSAHKIAEMNEGIGLSVDFPAWDNVYPNTVIRPFEDLDCTWETFIVYKNNTILSQSAKDFMEFSLQWLKNHKMELFHWPKEYEYLNDWYNL